MKKTLCLVFALLFICVSILTSCSCRTTSESESTDSSEQSSKEVGKGMTDVASSEFDDYTVCDHDFSKWNAIKQATCQEEGILIRTCSKCAESEQQSYQNTGAHEIISVSAIAATCKDTGLTEGSYCSVCGEVLVEQTIVPITDEHMSVVDEAVPATCTDTGLTEGSHCTVCGKILTAQEIVAKLEHIYDQEEVADIFLRTEATSSEAATYYYSCKCGASGTAHFSYGAPIADTTPSTPEWTTCSKKVYSLTDTYFYTSPDAISRCGRIHIGESVKVISTNGEWYEVKENNKYTNCVAYIKCSDVTDDGSVATFVTVYDNLPMHAEIGDKGAYLRKDISGSQASKVAFVQSGYITLVSMNEAKTWVIVRFNGTDSEERVYSGEKLYYCLISELVITGVPENWP